MLIALVSFTECQPGSSQERKILLRMVIHSRTALLFGTIMHSHRMFVEIPGTEQQQKAASVNQKPLVLHHS